MVLVNKIAPIFQDGSDLARVLTTALSVRKAHCLCSGRGKETGNVLGAACIDEQGKNGRQIRGIFTSCLWMTGNAYRVPKVMQHFVHATIKFLVLGR